MNDDLGRTWRGTVVMVERNFSHVCLRKEKSTETSVIIANFQAGVRTWVFAYTKQVCCHCNEKHCLNNANINDHCMFCVASCYLDGDLTKTGKEGRAVHLHPNALFFRINT